MIISTLNNFEKILQYQHDQIICSIKSTSIASSEKYLTKGFATSDITGMSTKVTSKASQLVIEHAHPQKPSPCCKHRSAATKGKLSFSFGILSSTIILMLIALELISTQQRLLLTTMLSARKKSNYKEAASM